MREFLETFRSFLCSIGLHHRHADKESLALDTIELQPTWFCGKRVYTSYRYTWECCCCHASGRSVMEP